MAQWEREWVVLRKALSGGNALILLTDSPRGFRTYSRTLLMRWGEEGREEEEEAACLAAAWAMAGPWVKTRVAARKTTGRAVRMVRALGERERRWCWIFWRDFCRRGCCGACLIWSSWEEEEVAVAAREEDGLLLVGEREKEARLAPLLLLLLLLRGKLAKEEEEDEEGMERGRKAVVVGVRQAASTAAAAAARANCCFIFKPLPR